MKLLRKYRTVIVYGLIAGAAVNLWQKYYGPVSIFSGLWIGSVIGLTLGLGKAMLFNPIYDKLSKRKR